MSEDPTSFSRVQSDDYWSSSASESNPVVALSVNLYYGKIFGGSNKGSLMFVWPVRSGQ